ncbi:MAG: 1,4-alpha-glucan branching protein GlgB [Sediminibacterium sp.]|nr:1,4-alpha-glucan branching protein GlgB [Sediminibacterium sp.]
MLKYEEEHFIEQTKSVWNYSLFSNQDLELFKQGKHFKLYTLFGNKQIKIFDQLGTYFAVWAPNAVKVSVIGNFNKWNKVSHPLFVRLDDSGIWEGFIPNIKRGELYKYHIVNTEGLKIDKGDPFCHLWELKPQTSSITWDCFYEWQDKNYMSQRWKKNSLKSPFSVYEVHLASWKRPDPQNEDTYFNYRDFASSLVQYVKEMGFTHIELMPIMEHPFDGSWGYQGTGYFAPTSRYGCPQDLAFFIECCHEENIGVILDWVPSHFPYDIHGLYRFDGFNTYEYADPKKGYHPDWNSYIFNYGRGEVRSFLISSAFFWLDVFHADGLRVDAVSSVLRLDYSRSHGQWEPNIFGGNGNLEAIEFVKLLNQTLYAHFPDTQIIAEESTDWPKISKPLFDGGMGFGMKWMMGWMHDTLNYFKIDPLFRKFHQDKLSFSLMYFYDENFMLPISHDEVVHGKSPMLYKMPGDLWQKFANLKLLYTYMFMHPGGKLLFMGNEFATTSEWNYQTELPWNLLEHGSHQGVQQLIKKLNQILITEKAIYEKQFVVGGFEWVDLNHRQESIIAFKRMGESTKESIYIILNLTPTNREKYTLQFEKEKTFDLLLNTDDKEFDGFGLNNYVDIKTTEIDSKHYLQINLAALAAVVFKEKQLKVITELQNPKANL